LVRLIGAWSDMTGILVAHGLLRRVSQTDE